MVNELFTCPRCGKETLWLHKKTYESVVIAFCGNCKFTYSFESSSKASGDKKDVWEEFKASYSKTQSKTPVYA